MKLRPFELAIITIFGLIGLLALGLLATYKPPADQDAVALGGTVTVWGTISADVFARTLRPLAEAQPAYAAIEYVSVEESQFADRLLNALAEGEGPDLVIVPHEDLVRYRSKIQPVPFENFPERDFKSTYVDGAEIFLMSDGVYAFPLAIDPLVMYWNRDTLASRNVLSAPTTWEAMVSDSVPTFTDRDFSRNITRSTVAFGEYRNVRHAGALLATLAMQGGSQLVAEGRDNTYRVLLNEVPGGTTTNRPLTNALTFYTNFASPSSPLYTWNRSLPEDRSLFLSEDLVFYFGKGSEAPSIASQNPNLNFDVAEVPQGATATVRRTYGTFYGLALLKAADNKAGAYAAMKFLGSSAFTLPLTEALTMVPAERSLIAAGSNDTYGRINYSAAVAARGWLMPSQDSVDTVFTQMVEDVLSNRLRPAEAADDAVVRIGQAY